jgi:hypothetical protein
MGRGSKSMRKRMKVMNGAASEVGEHQHEAPDSGAVPWKD